MKGLKGEYDIELDTCTGCTNDRSGDQNWAY
jgi:hypothetical protein